MRSLEPAFKRLASIRAQERALYLRERREIVALAHLGTIEVRAALKRLKLVPGETLIAHARRGWAIGIYLNARIQFSPRKSEDKWVIGVLCQSVLATGRPGKAKTWTSISVMAPRDIAGAIKVVGRITIRTAAHNA